MSPPVNFLVCPNCSEPFGDRDWFQCDMCKRPIGGCRACEWDGFIDGADASCDIVGCEHFGGEMSEEDAKRFSESVGRVARVQREMKERAGPFYELAKERSYIMQVAYRAAGSPRHVSRVITPNGVAYGVKNRDGYFDWVTEADWNAWMDWQRERARLHQQHGWNTEHARRYGKPTDGD